jgi:hypothetical protein
MQKRAQVIRFGLAAAAGVAGLFASPTTWLSPQNASLTTQAEARVGRPLTPGSVAGVNRRVDRRTARRAYYGTGAAIGTAAAVGAAGAYWGNQYYNSSYYGAYPGQYYGTYPGQYYGTYAAQASRPMSNKSYEGPSYYGPYAYATMDQVRTEAEAQTKAPAQAQAQAQVPTPTIRTAADWCASRYRSYNPTTRTFLAYDGRYYACP